MSKYKYGKTSNARLDTCHHDLVRLFDYAILHPDCPCDVSIVCGQRTEEEQEKAFASGVSKARFGQSPHNYSPSLAVDAAPYVAGVGIPWEANGEHRHLWDKLAEHILNCAADLNISVRWGNDWDGDGVPVPQDPDENFSDLPHWQLANWKELK